MSAGCAAGAVAVLGRWATRRTDALGRPRELPWWSVSVLLTLAAAALVPGVRRHQEEQRLADVAASLVGHRVTVTCQTGAAALVDAGAELGWVPFDAAGHPLPRTLIKRDQCNDLEDYLHGDHAHPSAAQVVAVHVLTHEAMHLRGQAAEALAECEAVQRDQLTAEGLGATAEQAMLLARRYWLTVYPLMPDDYRDSGCGPGGALDERLTSAPWSR